MSTAGYEYYSGGVLSTTAVPINRSCSAIACLLAAAAALTRATPTDARAAAARGAAAGTRSDAAGTGIRDARF